VGEALSSRLLVVAGPLAPGEDKLSLRRFLRYAIVSYASAADCGPMETARLRGWRRVVRREGRSMAAEVENGGGGGGGGGDDAWRVSTMERRRRRTREDGDRSENNCRSNGQ